MSSSVSTPCCISFSTGDSAGIMGSVESDQITRFQHPTEIEKSGGVKSQISQAYYTLAEDSSQVAIYDQT